MKTTVPTALGFVLLIAFATLTHRHEGGDPMKWKSEELSIKGVMLIKPAEIFTDHRGQFFEAFSHRDLSEVLRKADFVQDNQSTSLQGVLRGLHFQKGPHAQAKLVRVLYGTIYDVVVDIRRGSKTYHQWLGVELSHETHEQLYVPRGCAHGFLVLSNTAEVLYKVDKYYEPSAEQGIVWDDPELNIAWPSKKAGITPILSDKDKRLPRLADIEQELPIYDGPYEP